MKHTCLMCIIMLLAFYCFAQTAVMPAGEGTETNPYQITSIDNLYWITTNEDSWESHFIQMNDIDASSTANWNDSETDTSILEGWWPIEEFNGVYDGNHHVISGLTINRDEWNQAFIGESEACMIKNLGIIDGEITGYNATAPLVGSLLDGSSVINCFSNCIINSTGQNVGGLIGEVEYGSSVTYSHASGNVFADNKAGGLVGSLNSNSTISGSYSTGNVTGRSNIGGFIGYNTNNSLITNCYSTGNIVRGEDTTDNVFGGFCSYMYNSKITNCYSVGSVTYPGSTNPTDKGFIGYVVTGEEHLTTGNYWDTETSGQNSTGGTEGEYAHGKTTSQMKQQATYSEWDFITVWNINEGVTYPFLRISPVSNHDIVTPAIHYNLILHSVYPNPLNSGKAAIFNVEVKNFYNADLQIFNIKGQLIINFSGLNHGNHSLIWDGKNFNNVECPSGIYFYKLRSENETHTKKLLIIR